MVGLVFAAPFSEAATLQQTAQFNGVTAARLFSAFTNAAEHEAALGAIAAPVSIAPTVGATYAAFSQFGGGLTGKVVQVEKGDNGRDPQITMTWRMPEFKATDTDSMIVFTFKNNEKGAEIRMVQVNVPDGPAEKINTHWNTFYWDAWRPYMAAHVNGP
jgi:activator of HSP90 ATPase